MYPEQHVRYHVKVCYVVQYYPVLVYAHPYYTYPYHVHELVPKS